MAEKAECQQADRQIVLTKQADFVIKLFEADIRKNDIEYGGSLLYLGTVIYSFLFEIVGKELGPVLILSAVMIFLYVTQSRSKIKKRYAEKLVSVLSNTVYIEGEPIS